MLLGSRQGTLACLTDFYGLTILKKIITCCFLHKIWTEAILARQRICSHLFQDQQ